MFCGMLSRPRWQLTKHTPSFRTLYPSQICLLLHGMSVYRDGLQCPASYKCRGSWFWNICIPHATAAGHKRESVGHLLSEMKSCLGSPMISLSFYSLAFKRSNCFLFFFKTWIYTTFNLRVSIYRFGSTIIANLQNPTPQDLNRTAT